MATATARLRLGYGYGKRYGEETRKRRLSLHSSLIQSLYWSVDRFRLASVSGGLESTNPTAALQALRTRHECRRQ